MKPALTARDWLGKTGAALVLGFLLALGASGLLRHLAGVGADSFAIKGQLSMWLMAPIWSLVVALVFLFRTTLRAWLWLAAANIVLWGLLVVLGGLRP